MNQNELYYLAGLFDGEGWITIARANGKIHRLKNHSYTLQTGIVMREKYLVSKFLIFGGTVVKQSSRNKRHSTMYKWRISGNPLLKFVKLMYKFSTGKRKQLKLAIKFQTLKNKRCNTFSSIPVNIIEQYDKLYHKMISLNKRGIGK